MIVIKHLLVFMENNCNIWNLRKSSLVTLLFQRLLFVQINLTLIKQHQKAQRAFYFKDYYLPKWPNINYTTSKSSKWCVFIQMTLGFFAPCTKKWDGFNIKQREDLIFKEQINVWESVNSIQPRPRTYHRILALTTKKFSPY